MGWEALGQWGSHVARVERLVGGVANDVWSVNLGGRLAVARLGRRSDADLAWETELLRHLDREGMAVPVPIPTTDGRFFPANPGNVRVTDDQVVLIDWDEAHVDVPDLDLALPYNGAGLDAATLDVAEQAAAAWEAAVSWDDDYSKRRLAEVRPV
ncbi:hypothetical protein M1L60_01880 [Actinoplanes sp. TRM 88003]|uniref:Aminoglycoside phosphotransferase domain-containing protein n=1 Tax=Paractinoplanes aksuensis TaxID=2939490 RepID=A0ABT1DH05_9ACTN|nr:hypothetical protein [Actinoplanes aksuensis]MCO8269335.1 hypothetical protein [Actinoplanes aksuensis]